ncbi:hypothetical protein BC351_27630 [Paenibacillus ferrarius]|uniref:Uncharacterized protein n=1 Tax=Paenibacillus ferrarius TaxID=1469647 RepID=A0A1V4HK65_9BACL|nr:hypothetical protein [Paenibacillus ferrarius]OPH56714.1 hypothetical protein BC351_27630 [Paenibacillus ferrarius]
MYYTYPQYYLVTPACDYRQPIFHPPVGPQQFPVGPQHYAGLPHFLQGAKKVTPPSYPPQSIVANHNYLKSLTLQQAHQIIADKKAGKPIYLPGSQIYREEERVGATELIPCFGKWANIDLVVPFGMTPPLFAIFFVQQVHTNYANGFITIDGVNFFEINLPLGLIDTVIFC